MLDSWNLPEKRRNLVKAVTKCRFPALRGERPFPEKSMRREGA